MKISVRRATMFLILSVLVVSTTLFFSTTMAQNSDPNVEPAVESEVVSQNPSTHPMPDLPIVARDTGLPLEVVAKAMAFQDAFGEYAGEILERFPDQVSGIYADSPPGTISLSTSGHIQFTGEVPSGLTLMENVSLTGGGILSMADHSRRAELAAEALLGMGYKDYVTFYDPVDMLINIELLLPEGAPEPGKSDIVSNLRERVQADPELKGSSAAVSPLNIKITVSRGAGPFFTNQHSRGGNWLLTGAGVRDCTSGWSVSDGDFPPGADGIITAAHCIGLNEFEQPGVTPYGMTYVREKWGFGGDVEFHTTTHVELAEFYADETASDIRDVKSLKATSMMVGKIVCVYGCSSNVRTCGHKVEAVNVPIYDPDCSCNVTKLARTDGTSTIGGDSGGGWSMNFEAWGVHKGVDISGKGYFTPVEEAQAAANVIIKTK